MSGPLLSFVARMRGGVACPKCGSKQAPSKGSRDVLTCRDCGDVFSLNEIRGADGKIRFGSMLSEEEKHWLVADIRRTVWPER